MRAAFSLALACTLAACSTQYTANGPETILAPLQQPADWKAATSNDGQACRLTSGPAGLHVEIDRAGNSKISSSRPLWSGGFMNIRIAGTKYISVDDSFNARDSAALVEHFKRENTAYLEWSEPRGGSGDGLNQRNMRPLQLEGFSSALNNCWPTAAAKKPVTKTRR